MNGAAKWLATWLMMILLLLFLSKTSWGRPIVYGLLWLAILLLLVTHADELTSLFSAEALQLNG